ncbi:MULTISPECIES: hypothetical protein [unclassified Nocardioides]|uniref:hypothetical protein n=1 Tax=unclassified Nocardioides TaxID=2615069 RepID=UPI003014A9ED
MRPTALLSYLWDKQQHVLDSYLAQVRVDVVVTPAALVTDHLRRIAAAHGCEVVTVESLHPPRRRTAARSAPLQRALRRHLRTASWAPDDLDAESAAQVAGHLRTRLAVDVPIAVEVLDALARVDEAYDVVLFATSEDIVQRSKVATAWAGAHGIPTVHLAHAIALVDPYTVHAHLLADTLVVYGERGAEGYLDLGIARERIEVTGNPSWDVYASLRHERDRLRRDLLAEHDLDPDAPIVVFGTTWSAHLTAQETGAAHARTLSAFVAACVELERSGVRVNAVVKDRPNNVAAGRDLLHRLVSEHGPTTQRFAYATDDPEPWVAGSDVLVAVDSNLLVEAMLAGTPAVNLVGVALRPIPPAFDGESGVVEAEPDELAAELRAILVDPAVRSELAARTELRLSHYHHGGIDGRSTERVAALLVRLTRRPSRLRELRRRLTRQRDRLRRRWRRARRAARRRGGQA